MSRSILPALVLAVVVPSVGSAPRPKDPPGGVPYFPARVGMQWVYDQGGADMVFEVSDVKREDGKTAVTMARPAKGAVLSKYVITSDAVLHCGGSRFPFDPPLPKLKLPLTAGDSWDYEEPLLDGLRAHTGKMTVGKEEEVEVPAGKYRAVPVVFEVATHNRRPLPQPETYTFWYAKEVGLVKLTFPSGGRVLKSFNPEPAKK